MRHDDDHHRWEEGDAGTCKQVLCGVGRRWQATEAERSGSHRDGVRSRQPASSWCPLGTEELASCMVTVGAGQVMAMHAAGRAPPGCVRSCCDERVIQRGKELITLAPCGCLADPSKRGSRQEKSAPVPYSGGQGGKSVGTVFMSERGGGGRVQSSRAILGAAGVGTGPGAAPVCAGQASRTGRSAACRCSDTWLDSACGELPETQDL